MKKIYEAAKHSQLWSGIGFNDFEEMIRCNGAKTMRYNKGEIILMSGDSVNFIGMIVSGSVRVVKESMNGDISIIAELVAPDLFGEEFACANIDHSPATVQASEKCEVLLLDYKKVIAACSSACAFHSKLIENMLRIIAEKNLLLNQKIDILSKRKTREKLLAFFDLQRGASSKFTIPFNREEMANYLSVDRSAMSNELCKMRDEGIIRFHKNSFELLIFDIRA